MTAARPAISNEQRRARLAIRHHLAPAHRAATVEDAARDQVGLHATDPTSVYLSAWARVDGLDRATMERALYDDRTLVRMIGMRRTLFLEPLDLAPIVHAATGPTIAARERRRVEGWLIEAGIADPPGPWLARVEDETVAAIDRLGSGTAAELTKVVPDLAIQIPISVGKAYQGTVGVSTRVLFLLAMDGRITRGRPRGTWVSSQYRWEPMDRWVPMRERAAAHTEASAQAELVERWLRAFGPGTTDDLRWWTGLTLGADPASPRDPRHGRGRPRRRHDRARPGRRPRATDRDASNPGSRSCPRSIRPRWAGPRATGTSRRIAPPCSTGTGMPDRRSGSTVGSSAAGASVRTARWSRACWRTSGREAATAIAARAADLTAWMAGVRIMPRFPTPLQLELSA